MPQLYKLTGNLNQLQDFIDDAMEREDLTENDLEMYIDTLDSCQLEVEEKVENTIKFLQNIKGDIGAIKAEEERLAKKRKYLENKFNGIKDYTKNTLETAGIDKVKTASFNIRIQNNNPSISYLSEKDIAKEYRISQPDKFDGTRILTDLKNGINVKGVELVNDKTHIRFS